MNVGECGRVIAGVGAVEQRITYHAFAQTRLRIRPGNGLVDAGEHVAWRRHVGTDLEADPYRACVLAYGHAIASRDIGVLKQMVKHDGATGVALGRTGRFEGREHVIRQFARYPGNGLVHCAGNIFFGDDFESIHSAIV